MSYTSDKNITHYDEVLFSGSSDSFRTNLGLYLEVVSQTGAFVDPEVTIANESTMDINEREAFALDGDYTDKIIYIQSNTELQTTASSNSAVKTVKHPVRIIGNNDGSVLRTNSQWKAIVLGGTYEGTTYPPLITEGIFNDFTFEYNMPYTKSRARELYNVLPNMSTLDTYEISYDYNEYLREYQNASKIKNELELPNVYMLKMVDDSTTPDTDFPNYITEFVSMGDPESLLINGDATNSLFDPVKQYYPPPYAVQSSEIDTTTDPDHTMYDDKSYMIREYLTGAFVNNQLNEDTLSQILQKNRNLLFTGDAEDLLDQVNSEIHKMPMYAKIKYPVMPSLDGDQSFSQIMRDYNLEQDVLLYLKNNFITSTNDYLTRTIELSSSYEVGSGGTINYKYMQSTVPKTMRSQNLLSALVSIYNSTNKQGDTNSTFVNERTLASISSENPDSRYRYYKSAKTIKAIEDSVALLNDDLISVEENPVKTISELEEQKSNRPPDTFAYKLTKLGGSFLDSERKITSIQDFYFMNSPTQLQVDGTDFAFYDTQVKHDEQYLYTLTAYAIVKGYEYQYSDLRISRNIGEVVNRESGSFVVTTDPEKFCTEMYDPVTGDAVDQLLNTESNLMGEGVLIAVGADEQRSAQMQLFRQHLLGLGGKEQIRWRDVLDVTPVTISDSEVINIPTLGVTLEVDLDDYVENIFSRIEYSAGYATDYASHPDWVVGYDRWAELTEEDQTLEMELYKMWAVKRVYTEDERTFVKASGGSNAPIQVNMLDPTKNRFATNAQFKSQFKFCADFNLSIAPAARIVEIPIGSKVVKILDNPPVAPDITPFSRLDDSQTIGFFVNLESFRLPQNTEGINLDSKSIIGQYPTPMGDMEQQKREIYLTSHDMLIDDLIMKDSVSKVSRLEVYRIDYKPTSIDDFMNNLVHTKELLISSESSIRNYFTNCIYEERIQTNKKYYYFMRFINENGDSSYLAPIQVVELVDDGGYKYPVFDVMFETDLEEPTPTQDNTMFKKLLQITPDVKHMIINDADVDYTQPAATQIDKLNGMIGSEGDMVWGKTFKFRITSKKTGKKIDLNIKYNLRDS